MITQLAKLQIYPVTPDRWKDFEKQFGQNGAGAGCWSRSVWWRSARAEFSQKQYDGNKRAIKKIIMTEQAPGILAYADGESIIEGYPVDAVGEKKNATSVFTGVASTFKRVGFVEVARRTPMRPIMRYFVE